MSDGPELECAVCGDLFDPREDTYFRLGEEQRPVPDNDEPAFDDFFSRAWHLCWPCVYTKLGVVPENEPEDDD